MSQPGWYPDPSGQPNQLRYWDGRTWTQQVTAAPETGQGAGGSGGGRGWWVLLAGVLVVALIALGIWRLTSPSDPGPVATYSPTVSAWNESEEPSPTPSPTPTPTPSPTPSREPSARETKLRCDALGEPPAADVSATGSRLTVGGISMPVPTSAGWEGPSSQPLIEYGLGAFGYLKVVERHEDTGNWFNTLIVGPTNFDPPADLETQARSIIACLATIDSLTKYKAPTTLKLTATTISGHQAVQADATYSWDYPDLNSKGSLIRVVVVDTSQGPCFFFGEASKEHADVIAEMNRVSAGLQVS